MFQLENQYTLFDYSINVNDVIQLMVRTVIIEEKKPLKNVILKAPTQSTSASSSSSSDKVVLCH